MAIRKQISSLADQKEAVIFGMLYSVVGNEAVARLDDAISKADVAFREEISNWVVSAKDRISKGSFPVKNLFIRSNSYQAELAPNQPKGLVNILDLKSKLSFIRGEIHEDVQQEKSWLSFESEDELSIEKMKVILFMDAVMPVFDAALSEIFSEKHEGYYIDQLKLALNEIKSSDEVVQFKASKVQMAMLYELVRCITFADEVIFYGHAAEFFKKYQEFAERMDEFFSWLKAEDGIPANVSCEAFNWNVRSNIFDAELEHCMILRMY